MSLKIANNFQPVLGEHFYILDNVSFNPAQTTTGSFTNGNTVTDDRGNAYIIFFGDTDPNNPGGLAARDIGLLTVSVVPEPGAWALLGLGALMLVGFKHHRRRAPR